MFRLSALMFVISGIVLSIKASWEILDMPTDRGFGPIFALNEATIFVEGHEGLWKTFDGNSWSLDSTNGRPRMHPAFVYFADDTLGFIRGERLTIDGGKTWQLADTINGHSVQSITFPPKQSLVGYGANYTDDLFTTTDGGWHWDKLAPLSDVYPGFEENKQFGEICFPTFDTGYVTATCTKIINDSTFEFHTSYFKTVDGGQTWMLNEEGLWNDDFMPGLVDFPENANVGYMAGVDYPRAGMVYKTTDGGETWDTVLRTPDGYPNIYDICFPETDQVGYVLNDTMIHKTTDGGKTWRTFGLGQDTVFLRCHFLNDSVGFISGTGTTAYNSLNPYTPGFVMKTTDGLLGIAENDWVDVEPEVVEFSASSVFTDELALRYEARKPGRIKVSLYDASGREVESLGFINVHPGPGSINFNGANLPSGVFFVRVEFTSVEGSQNKTIKAVKVR